MGMCIRVYDCRYTRVSEMLQWILSSKGLGEKPAQMLSLQITGLSLPPRASVRCLLVCIRHVRVIRWVYMRRDVHAKEGKSQRESGYR